MRLGRLSFWTKKISRSRWESMVSARKKVENDFFGVFPPHDTKKTLFFFLFTINALRNQKLAEYELVCNSPDFCHNVVIENWERWKRKWITKSRMTGSGSPNDYENPKLRAYDGKWLHPMTQKKLSKKTKTKTKKMISLTIALSPILIPAVIALAVCWFLG